MLPLTKIEEISTHQPNKAALITDEVTLSWKNYRNIVKNNIHFLLSSGQINVNTTRAIIISENNWQLFILYSCLVSSRISYSGIDYTMSDVQKIAAIERSSANTVFYSEKNKPSDEILLHFKNTVIFVPINHIKMDTKDTNFDWQEAIKKLNHNDDILSFSFTSGTSGLPKCIYRNSSFDKKRLEMFTKMFEFTGKDIFLVTMPFYHVSVNGWAKLVLVNAGTIIFSNFLSDDDLYYKLVNYNITSMLITPSVLKRLNDKLVQNNFINKTVRFIMVGGKNFPTILKDQTINIFGPIVNEYYGSSETGINTIANSLDIQEFPESSGKSMEGSKIVILDTNKNILSSNQVGRITINSFQNAAGYLKKDMEDCYIDNERYIITSDYGYINEKGYVFVTQRVIFDSNKVSTRLFSLENSLRMIRGINDLVIVQDSNNQYKVYLMWESNLSKITMHNVLQAVDNLLKSESILFKVIPVDKINYSLSGKVKYTELLSEV